MELDIFDAIIELKELMENQEKCQFDEDAKKTLEDMLTHIENIEENTYKSEVYLLEIRDMTENIEHVAQYGFSLALVVLGAVILIKTFFTGW